MQGVHSKSTISVMAATDIHYDVRKTTQVEGILRPCRWPYNAIIVNDDCLLLFNATIFSRDLETIDHAYRMQVTRHHSYGWLRRGSNVTSPTGQRCVRTVSLRVLTKYVRCMETTMDGQTKRQKSGGSQKTFVDH